MPAHSKGSNINDWSHSTRSWRHLLFWDTAAIAGGSSSTGHSQFYIHTCPCGQASDA